VLLFFALPGGVRVIGAVQRERERERERSKQEKMTLVSSPLILFY